ncbi:hypothetical protein G7Y89_g4651 [Cudoniella acicularis]|uniref:Uncharacterized protein n=1 Tax=Cudoniella acicularis TaxID=354080 RepID=A0A8H4RR75_9HELO|nr:hypothetical protein G7Y89_g4651 [Cudoniella acicularis]
MPLEQNGTVLLREFSLASRHLGWFGPVHRMMTAKTFVCALVDAPGVFPLATMLQIQFVQSIFPDEVRFEQVSLPWEGREGARKRDRMLQHPLKTAHLLLAQWKSLLESGPENRTNVGVQDCIIVAKAEALFVAWGQPVRSFEKMSPELWDIVLGDLSSLNGKYAAEAFNFTLSERQQKHSNIWGMIIKEEEEWTSIAMNQGLNPILIGDDLYALYDNPTSTGYIAVITGDISGDIRFERDKFLDSLRAHDRKENEVVFHESNITLNINEPL